MGYKDYFTNKFAFYLNVMGVLASGGDFSLFQKFTICSHVFVFTFVFTHAILKTKIREGEMKNDREFLLWAHETSAR